MIRMFGVKKHSGQTLRLTSDFDRLSVALRAGSHHVAGLLALVADTVLLTGAVTRQVADLAAVVALLSLGAVTGEMAVTTARVASLLTSTGSVSSLRTAEAATVGGALAGDVANLAALVALSSRSALESTLLGSSAGVGALAREMTGEATSVASLLLHGTSALAAHVSILSTVVANRGSTLGAFTSLVATLAAVVASASSSAAVGRSRSVSVHCCYYL
jgi:hypothetical protein